jgi:hypothetical protein
MKPPSWLVQMPQDQVMMSPDDTMRAMKEKAKQMTNGDHSNGDN